MAATVADLLPEIHRCDKPSVSLFIMPSFPSLSVHLPCAACDFDIGTVLLYCVHRVEGKDWSAELELFLVDNPNMPSIIRYRSHRKAQRDWAALHEAMLRYAAAYKRSSVGRERAQRVVALMDTLIEGDAVHGRTLPGIIE